MATTEIQKTPFVRELASSGEYTSLYPNTEPLAAVKKILIHVSTDRKTRDKALESLTLFLKARKDLSLLELLKVWRGLFFCTFAPSSFTPSYWALTRKRLLPLRPPSNPTSPRPRALILPRPQPPTRKPPTLPARILDYDWHRIPQFG